MKKNRWLAALVAVSVLSLAACNNEAETETEVRIDVPAQTTPVEEKPKENMQEVDEKVTEEVPVDEEAKTILTSTGTYVETVDATHVKLQIGETVSIYELIAETKGIFEGVKPNASITFDYYEGTEGKRVLVSLLLNEEVTEEKQTTSEVKQDEWVFVGMIDGHSSEFRKGSSFVVAQYNEDLFDTVNQLGDEDTVVVNYTVNEQGSYVLQSIAKK